MIDVTKAEEIWKAYEAGRTYKAGIDLYDTVEDNERFYIGDQWHGLDAPNIPKPVLNVLKRTVSMLVARICSDDLAANIQPFLKDDESEERTKMMSREVDKVLELCDIKQLGKVALRNAAVDGDGCVYTYWDGDAPTGQESKGAIRAELIENINVIFENPHTSIVEGQRYIIIARRLPLEEVRERAKKNGASDIEEIKADEDQHQGEQGNDNALVTLLTVLYKDKDTVHAVEATEKVIVRKEWDTELKRYPVAWLPWERQRNCMHGRAALTDMIPNQVAINKAYAGMLRVIERYGFPTRVVNNRFVQDWDGTPGRVLKVTANQDVDVRKLAADIDGAQINPSISAVIGELITYTRDFMGTNDASAGNVRPDNASAIIALQNADTVPLELTRQAYNGFIESIVRNIVDMMHANYGVRLVERTITDEIGKATDIQEEFDFAELSDANLRISVDIGAASMWSEITQMDSLNALFTSGIMDDPRKLRLYIEIVPDKYVPGKAKLLQWCDEMEAQIQPIEPYGEEPLEYNNDLPTIAGEGMYPNV